MEYVYLGLFQKVFEWVLSKIVDPIYRFVSGLLTTVLSWVFQEILAPILLPILEDALDFFLKLFMEVISTRLYLLMTGLLKLIDYLETAFDVFIGLRDVTYTEPGGGVVTGSLVEVLIQQKTVSTVFWVITLGALGLALLLTIYATAKSAFDLDFENKRPVSKVLTAMMKTFIQFFMVPFLVYFMLKLSAVILRGVTSVLMGGNTTSLGRIVFMIASLNAAKDGRFNIGSDTVLNIELGTSPQDTVRYPFYTLTGGNGIQLKDYANMKQVVNSFNLASFDYLVGFIAAVFLLFTIGVCLIIFVQRIFEIMLLYLVSPYFVCMMPLDDGEKFSRWRELFIGKCFTGFGSAIGMRLFLMICPMVMGNRIKFGASTSPEMDYMMKLFFLAGGAWAVYKSGPMITSLISSQAGSSESNTASVAGGMLFAHTVGAAMAKGQQAVRTGLSGGGRGAMAGGSRAGALAGGGRYGGSKGGADSGKLSWGKRINAFKQSGQAAGYNLQKGIGGMGQAMRDLKAGDTKAALRSAGHMIRGYDSLRNAQRALAGNAEKSNLEGRVQNKVERWSQMAGSTLDTADSMKKAGRSIGAAAGLLTGPGKLSDKTGQIGGAFKDVYRAKRQFDKLSDQYSGFSHGTMSVDGPGSQLKVNDRGQVMARKLLGSMFEEAPSQGAVNQARPQAGPGAFVPRAGENKSPAVIRGRSRMVSAGTMAAGKKPAIAAARVRHTISSGTTGGAESLRGMIGSGRVRYRAGSPGSSASGITRHTISAGTMGGAGEAGGSGSGRYGSGMSGGVTRHTVSAGTMGGAGALRGVAGEAGGSGSGMNGGVTRHTVSAGTMGGAGALRGAAGEAGGSDSGRYGSGMSGGIIRHTVSAGSMGGAGALRGAAGEAGGSGSGRYGSGMNGGITRHTVSVGTMGGAAVPRGVAGEAGGSGSGMNGGVTRHTISAGTVSVAGAPRGAAGEAGASNSGRYGSGMSGGIIRHTISVGIPGGGEERGRFTAADRSSQTVSHRISVKTVDCAPLPQVRRASCSMAGEKVAYSDLSIRGLQYSRQQGKGQITRRNSR